ncbi:MAG TPA: hypothetical protein VNO75_12380 [Gemmatimonadaceae bacterium]|nr:hypothetical protein [Gemmatimonadaceae bacterium]
MDLLDRMGALPTRSDAMERGLKVLADLKKIDERREAAISENVGSVNAGITEVASGQD